MPSEMRTICESAGAPAICKQWGIALEGCGLESASKLVSAHEGLGSRPATTDGIKYLVNTVATWAALPANAGQVATLPDVFAAGGDAEAQAARAAAIAGGRWLHRLAYSQAEHSIGNELAAQGLGDAVARQDAEKKRAKENATKEYARQRDLVLTLYNKKVDPGTHADAKLVATVALALLRGELPMPDLNSALYGKKEYGGGETTKRLVMGVDNAVVAADDDTVECNLNGLVLMQLERALLVLLCAGAQAVTAAQCPSVGTTGMVYKGTPQEHQVHFGLDAFDALMRRFTYLSAYAKPKALLLAWSRQLVPRMATKMQDGHTAGSAAMQIVEATQMLEVQNVVALNTQQERGQERGDSKKGAARNKLGKAGGKVHPVVA